MLSSLNNDNDDDNDDNDNHYHSHIKLFVVVSNRKSAAVLDWYGISLGVSEQEKRDCCYGH
jgi:hypothetical protein